MQEIYRVLARLTQTDLTVMIAGESGTGKELVARVLHDYGKRRQGPFVALNMAAIPRELIESELFGHEKGAFTGALAQKRGKFDMAHQGTIFLDEIADMSLKTQAKVLRILQERTFERVGGVKRVEVDVRVLAATNKSLEEEIARGAFREDLFYRLKWFRCAAAPGSAGGHRAPRRALPKLSDETGRGPAARPGGDPGLPAVRLARTRELRNMMERLVLLTRAAGL
jgi:DNA-binding NtrC family response regulator